MTKHLVSDALHEYCEQHTSLPADYLRQLERQTYLSQQLPHMVSGHLQGRVLSFIAKLMQPKYILEVGTFTGYAALCLAEGLQPDGKLITIECDEEKEKICNDFFALSPYHHQIELHIGDARSIIPTLNYSFDISFIDADKINYSHYYDLIIEKTRSGGIILADNVLYNGEVVQEKQSKNAKAMDNFNKIINADNRVEVVILPIRDGISAIRKK